MIFSKIDKYFYFFYNSFFPYFFMLLNSNNIGFYNMLNYSSINKKKIPAFAEDLKTNNHVNSKEHEINTNIVI